MNNKLNINKKTVSQMSRSQMVKVNGGKLCLVSCPSGSRKGKSCCPDDGMEPYDPWAMTSTGP